MPDPHDLAALIDIARRAYLIPSSAAALAVGGSDLAISLLPRLIQPATLVTIVAPTYSSHEKAWRAAGHPVRFVSDLADMGSQGIGVVVNPNNPDGRRWPAARLAEAAAKLNPCGFLVVDEAFCDETPELSVLRTDAELSRMLVLRSFGKFFGLAGLRLGFVVTGHAVGRDIAAAMSDWPVSGPAIAIGCKALSDLEWAHAARKNLAVSVPRLDATLRTAGFTIIGGTSLFRLAQHAEAHRMFETLARHGILVRPFADPSLLRFGLPSTNEEYARLASALKT